MWDSIFILISFFEKAHKKKDLFYLLNSRLQDPTSKSLIINHDVNQRNKCKNCQDFRPWIIVKNTGEGLFLTKKFVEKYQPWVSLGLLSNIYENIKSDLTFKYPIFFQMNKFNNKKKLYKIINKNRDTILDMDIRLANNCEGCENFIPWLLIRNKPEIKKFIDDLNNLSDPFSTIKYYEPVYWHQIPDEIKKLTTWSNSAEGKYENLRITPPA